MEAIKGRSSPTSVLLENGDDGDTAIIATLIIGLDRNIGDEKGAAITIVSAFKDDGDNEDNQDAKGTAVTIVSTIGDNVDNDDNFEKMYLYSGRQ